MISSKRFQCTVCCYETDRKYNLHLHTSSPNACDKRFKRTSHKADEQTIDVVERNNDVDVVETNIDVIYLPTKTS